MAHAKTSAASNVLRDERLCPCGSLSRDWYTTGNDTIECGKCRKAREDLDTKLVCEMNAMRGLPTRCNTRPELKAWQL